ncbi:MAG TPA: nitroreductase family protein [Ktedonobacteraceae bacterium]|nr:nitroreductase family protein [Ktedonobacteraceae bacterium]
MTLLDLTPDQLLSTTRAVRKRLDLTRPVEPELIRECVELAVQAPTGSNSQRWHFIVVTDADKRKALGEFYRQGMEAVYGFNAGQSKQPTPRDPELARKQARILSSAQHLAVHMHEVPVLVVPCIEGRLDGVPSARQAGVWGSILPAVWSFMLAARARGLGTAWTTLHLLREKEAAEVLGIPYEKVTQAALIPVAYTIGTDFKPGPRKPLDEVLHWDQW